MSKALLQSLAFHLLLIAIIFLSSTSLFSRKETEVAITAITVDLLPVAEKTNIKRKPKPVPKKAKPKEKPKPKPPPAKPKPKPKEPEKPKPKPKKKEKPKDRPQKKKPEEKQEDELEALLKSLDEEEPVETEITQDTQEFDPNSPETISYLQSIVGKITRQITPCWIIPAGARNAGSLSILVDVDISRDGRLTFVGFTEPNKYYSDSFYQVAADSARRAILDPRCNPLREIPSLDKYEIWRELTINFDPQQQIY